MQELKEVPEFDIFIPCSYKDENKLKFVIQAIRNNIVGFDKIYVCSPSIILDKDKDIEYLISSEVLSCDISGWKYRPGWCYQQHLKLFQEATLNDWYLTVDSDLIFNRPVEFFKEIEGKIKPVLYQLNSPGDSMYFEFSKKIIDVDKMSEKTCATSFNLFCRSIINEMLIRNNYTRETFIKKSQEIISENCYIGEPDLYGSYVLKYHKDSFIEQEIKSQMDVRVQHNGTDQLWTDDEIGEILDESKEKDIDLFLLHSWVMNLKYNGNLMCLENA